MNTVTYLKASLLRNNPTWYSGALVRGEWWLYATALYLWQKELLDMTQYSGLRLPGYPNTRKLKMVLLAALLILPACQNGPGKADSTKDLIQNRGSGKDRWYDALPRPIWKSFRRIDQSQDWFEVYAVAPGVFAIYEPGQFEEVISYLIVGSDKALLFDTGLGIGDMKQLVTELTPLEPVVLNSHTHYDHVGEITNSIRSMAFWMIPAWAPRRNGLNGIKTILRMKNISASPWKVTLRNSPQVPPINQQQPPSPSRTGARSRPYASLRSCLSEISIFCSGTASA